MRRKIGEENPLTRTAHPGLHQIRHRTPRLPIRRRPPWCWPVASGGTPPRSTACWTWCWTGRAPCRSAGGCWRYVLALSRGGKEKGGEEDLSLFSCALTFYGAVYQPNASISITPPSLFPRIYDSAYASGVFNGGPGSAPLQPPLASFDAYLSRVQIVRFFKIIII